MHHQVIHCIRKLVTIPVGDELHPPLGHGRRELILGEVRVRLHLYANSTRISPPLSSAAIEDGSLYALHDAPPRRVVSICPTTISCQRQSPARPAVVGPG
jgi:hypothetical protein